MIKVGDLVRIIKKSSYYLSEQTENKNVTGVVVGVTLDEPFVPGSPDDEPVGYWINVVFLDNSKATLFHDEVEVLA